MIGDVVTLIKGAAGMISMFEHSAEKAGRDKETYIGKLEQATGDDVFKYILLINVSALEGYVAQTRIQAEQSFRLSRIVAVLGFIILATGIAFRYLPEPNRGCKSRGGLFGINGRNSHAIYFWSILLPL